MLVVIVLLKRLYIYLYIYVGSVSVCVCVCQKAGTKLASYASLHKHGTGWYHHKDGAG